MKRAKRSNNLSGQSVKMIKKAPKDKYITRLARDLKAFREREASGEEISSAERRNMRARERRAMEKMRKTAEPLIEQANKTLENLRSRELSTLSMERVLDAFSQDKRETELFSLSGAKTYQDIVEEITLASTFLNSPDTAQLTATRQQRNRKLKRKYGNVEDTLKNNTYIESGLIPTEEDAKEIFRHYREIEEYWSSLIGKEGQRGVYGSDKLILYMIDIHNQGLDEGLYGMEALKNFSLERTPEYQELFKERNKVTGISGLFTQKGKGYGRLAGLL